MDQQLKAKQAVIEYWNNNYSENYSTDTNNVVTVWFCYILGGWKTLMFINSESDNYFEVTYSVEKKEMYLDHYLKVHNEAIPDSVVNRIAELRDRLTR